MKKPISISIFQLYFRLFLAFTLVIPQGLQAQSQLDVFLSTRSSDLNSEERRELFIKYNSESFDPKQSKHWPQKASEEAYAWILEQVPETEKLPPDEIKSYFERQLLTLKLAQNGYLDLAQTEIPRLTFEILHISSSVGRLSDLTEERKEQMVGEIVRATAQWSIVTLGVMSRSEKTRVQWILGRQLQTWMVHSRSTIHWNNTVNGLTRMARGFGISVRIFMTALGSTMATNFLRLDALSDMFYSSITMPALTAAFLTSLIVDAKPKWLSGKTKRVTVAAEDLIADLREPLRSGQSFGDAKIETVRKTLREEREDYEKSSKRTLSEQELKNLLVDPMPTIQGVQGFLRNASRDQDKSAEYNRLISENKELRSLSEEGKKFREWYYKSLSQDFSGPRLSWILDPEAEILRRIEVLEGSDPRERFTEIHIRKAQSLALDETLRTFGLNPNSTLDDIERGRFTDPTLSSAYEFFKRRFFQLQSKEEVIRKTDKQSVDEFKKYVVDSVQELRILNFKSAIALATSNTEFSRKQKFYFQSASANSKLELSALDLVDAKIDFDPSGKSQPDFELLGRGLSQFLGQSSKEYWSFNFKYEAVDSIKNPNRLPRIPANPMSTIEITTDKATLRLTEADFNLLLFRLNSPEDSNKNLLAQEHYLLEASRRDSHLADVVSFILEKSDSTLDALRMRLKSKIVNRTSDESMGLTLTERIRNEGISPLDTPHVNRLEDVKWGGLLRHTNYWSIRDSIAKSQSDLTALFLLQQSGANSPKDLAHNKKAKTKQTPFKTESRYDKHHFLKDLKFVKALAIATAAYVLAPPLNEFYVNHIQPEIDKLPSIEISLDNIKAPVLPKPARKALDAVGGAMEAVDKAFDKLIGERQKSQTKERSQSESPFPRNKGEESTKQDTSEASKSSDKQGDKKSDSPDHSQDGKSPSSDMESDTLKLTDSFDPTNHTSPEEQERQNKTVLFEIIPGRISIDDIPLYMNLMAKPNQPRDIWTAETRDKPEAEIVHEQKDAGGEDFSIKSNLYQQARDGILPIVSPAGYRIMSLELTREGKSSSVPFYDYRVLQLKSSGLHYVKFNFSRDSTAKFKYTVRYKKMSFGNQSSSILPPLNRQILAQLGSELNSVGAKELALRLQSVTDSPGNPITIDQLATVFAESGVYTYDKERAKVTPSLNRFGAYSKFLRDGVFYYQCTGSNRLLADFLTAYYKIAKEPVAVSNLVGFLRKGAQVLGGSGHMHTLVSRTDKDFHYFALDGTPKNMDPKYESRRSLNPTDHLQREKEQSQERKRQEQARKEEEKREQERLAEQKRQEETKKQEFEQLKKDLEEKEKKERNLPGLRANPINVRGLKRFPTPKTKEELEYEEKLKALNEDIEKLEDQRSRYLAILMKKAEEDNKIKGTPNRSQLPGLRILQVVPILLEISKDKISLDVGLFHLMAMILDLSAEQLKVESNRKLVQERLEKLIAAAGGNRSRVLNDQLRIFKEDFELAVKKQKDLIEARKKSPYLYLLDPNLQHELNAAFALITARNWVRPERPGPESCKALLN